MPRYFFHVIDGYTEGTELAGLEEARTEAVVLSGAMLKDAGRKFWNNGEWRLQVADEAGEQCAPCALVPSTPEKHPFKGRPQSSPRPCSTRAT